MTISPSGKWSEACMKREGEQKRTNSPNHMTCSIRTEGESIGGNKGGEEKREERERERESE